MRPLIAATAAIWIWSGIAYAQSTGEKPVEAQPPAVTLNTGNETRHAREADARHCLELKDNMAVIRCAERYLYRGSARAGGD